MPLGWSGRGVPAASLCLPRRYAHSPTEVADLRDAALAKPGPAAWSVATGALRSVVGCTVAYEVLEPAGPAVLTVVLAHGFLRDGASMLGWGELAASHGLRSVVVSTCAPRSSTPASAPAAWRRCWLRPPTHERWACSASTRSTPAGWPRPRWGPRCRRCSSPATLWEAEG